MEAILSLPIFFVINIIFFRGNKSFFYKLIPSTFTDEINKGFQHREMCVFFTFFKRKIVNLMLF